MPLSPADFSDFIEEIKFAQDVVIDNMDLDASQVEEVAKAIKEHKNLKSLVVRCQFSKVSYGKVLAEASNNPSLIYLEIMGGMISKEDGEKLADGIKASNSLKTLTFRAFGVGTEWRTCARGIEFLSDAIRLNTSIHTLGGKTGVDLSTNDAKGLEAILKGNTSIIEYRLSGQALPDPNFIGAIFSGLTSNTTCKKLTLLGLSAEDCVALGIALPLNVPLPEINFLFDFPITTPPIALRAIKAIEEGLRQNTNIIKFSLPPATPAGQEAYESIQALIQRNIEAKNKQTVRATHDTGDPILNTFEARKAQLLRERAELLEKQRMIDKELEEIDKAHGQISSSTKQL